MDDGLSIILPVSRFLRHARASQMLPRYLESGESVLEQHHGQILCLEWRPWAWGFLLYGTWTLSLVTKPTSESSHDQMICPQDTWQSVVQGRKGAGFRSLYWARLWGSQLLPSVCWVRC